MFRLVSRIIFGVTSAYVAASCYGELNLLRLTQSAEANADGPATMHEGLQFANPTQLSIFIEEGRRAMLFPWTEPLPEWFVLALLAPAMGLLGGIVREVRSNFASGHAGLRRYDLMGAITGATLLAASAMVPSILADGELQFRPASVAALCFFGGIFSVEAWRFLQHVAKKKFSPA